MVSVLPPGIDVRKLQRSHSEISRVEPLSGLPSHLFFGLPIRFSVFTQTLSDLTLDWSKVRSDKLLCVNTAKDTHFQEQCTEHTAISCCSRVLESDQRNMPHAGSIPKQVP